MTDHDYELLSRFLDRELGVEETQHLRRRLLAEPLLRAELARLKAANDRVAASVEFDGADAVPARISALLADEEAAVARLSTVRRAGWGLAIAASILAASGVLLNPQWQQRGADPDTVIADILEHTPSRGSRWDRVSDSKRIRPVLSFRNNVGDWCREYVLRENRSNWRGVACREGGQWRTRIISEVAHSESVTEYRPAGSADSDRIAAFIDENAADIPLNARQEAQVIESNWEE